MRRSRCSVSAEREKREVLFGRFLEEAAKLYVDAQQNKREDPTAMINIYAPANRIRLISSAQVVEKRRYLTRIKRTALLIRAGCGPT